MHPSTDSAAFQFNLSTDSGSNYNVTKLQPFLKLDIMKMTQTQNLLMNQLLI
jgi:hypothetical protein